MFSLSNAIILAKLRGVKVNKDELAQILYPDQCERSRQVTISRLMTGKAKLLSSEKIKQICSYCHCTLDEFII